MLILHVNLLLQLLCLELQLDRGALHPLDGVVVDAQDLFDILDSLLGGIVAGIIRTISTSLVHIVGRGACADGKGAVPHVAIILQLMLVDLALDRGELVIERLNALLNNRGLIPHSIFHT